ncbi:uncharacterized protein N7482_005084 [Penicillium canariense]|uniref:Uncharacterized protein n=1 Tax=Penicillium canariense TaxID=189055 RepID=A0A9W9I453_9EURO|nr:uncharacterized protein N7482_005084 [Penicillium canariense]KAJ5166303.1 hypothetical protein N7482_005084 [Penicillium canariense]
MGYICKSVATQQGEFWVARSLNQGWRRRRVSQLGQSQSEPEVVETPPQQDLKRLRPSEIESALQSLPSWKVPPSASQHLWV